MKNPYYKYGVAIGYFFLIGFIAISLIFVTNEFNIFSNDHAGLFPENQKILLKTKELSTNNNSNRSFAYIGGTNDVVPILTYHRIIKSSDISKHHQIDGEINQMIVLKEDFEKQMLYLKENGYITLTLEELYLFFTNKINIPNKSVVLTFDDGYKDNYVEAYPILKKYNFNAVNFIITSKITKRKYTYTPDYVQYFSIKELKKAEDVFEYQSHTYNFHRQQKDAQNNLNSYLTSESTEKVSEDIQISVYNLNGENMAFAYPYGEYLPSTIGILKELGFKMAFTVENRIANRNNDHVYEIPRFSIFHDTSFDKFVEYVKN